jgi:prefoldin subunit 5
VEMQEKIPQFMKDYQEKYNSLNTSNQKLQSLLDKVAKEYQRASEQENVVARSYATFSKDLEDKVN